MENNKIIVKTPRQRLREAERENMALKAENAKLSATLEYVAMMADVDIEEDENAEQAI